MLLAFLSLSLAAKEREYDYVLFDNSLMDGSFYYSSVSYDSLSWVENLQGRLPVCSCEFSSPGNSLKLAYLSGRGGWRADVIFQDARGADNFKSPDLLSMRIKAEAGIDSDVLPDVCLVAQDGTRSEAVSLSRYLDCRKEGKWQTVSIPLSDFGIRPTSRDVILKVHSVSFSKGGGSDREAALYLDDIEILPAQVPAVRLDAPQLVEAEGGELHIDIRWKGKGEEGVKYYKIYRSFDGKKFVPVASRRQWMDRYADFIGKTGVKAYYKVSAVDYSLKETPCSDVMSAFTRAMSDDELLDMVQKANFRYYWEQCEPESGLAREDVPGKTDMIATGASGFGIMAILSGIHRGFITREQGVQRFLKITSFLEKADKYHGAFPHFMDGTTGKTIAWFGKQDNGGDLVETAFLYEGLLSARQFFDGDSKDEKLIRDCIDGLWKNVEWNWYKQTDDSPYLYWHWSPDQAWVIHHRLIGWNETMIVYLLAIMSPMHSVSPSMYYSGWASHDDIAAAYRKAWGRVSEGERYENGNTYYGRKLDVAVSDGGPLFFTHYSFMGFDPHKLTDRYTNYFENNKAIAEVNLRYCMENQGRFEGYGFGCWGMTASDQMEHYSADEPVKNLDNGTIAPTGALASFPYTPEASMAALKNYYRNYGRFLWGEYGFRDAFNLSENWVSSIFMGLNQAPIVVMIENYRSGTVWNLFMSHPDVQKGLKKLNSIKYPQIN